MNFSDREREMFKGWIKSPTKFVRDVFKAEPDAWQIDVLENFRGTKRQALKACKGPGKSTVLAWLAWNFLVTRLHPKVIATSISGDNLKDGLWTEMAKWQHRSPMLTKLFAWSSSRIVHTAHPETWFATARTWSRDADPTQQSDTLAGLHADYLLFIIDEAGGVPSAVAATAEAGLSTGLETHLLIAGNPTMLDGPLYSACTSARSLWWVKEITADPDDPQRTPRVSVEWAREQIQMHGRDHPYVMVNVLGKFPPQQANSIFGVEEVQDACTRTVDRRSYEQAPKVLGVDVARFGDDRTVLAPRQGRACFLPRVMRNLDVMSVAGVVADYINKWKPQTTFIDAGGVGGGVYDRLQELGFSCVPVDAGGRALRPDRYANKRAEMWGDMAEWMRGGGCFPDLPELRAELVAPTFKFRSTGAMLVESKDELKKRGHASPDVADAYALTFAAPVVAPNPQVMPSSQEQNAFVSDYDPFGEGTW